MYLRNALMLVLMIKYSQAQDANCDYVQNVVAGQTYYIYSPNYPNNYRPGVQCRWIGVCPSGYNCRVEFTDIDIPSAPSCSIDRLLISKTGDPQLTSAEYYCGRGALTVVSTGQRISVGLTTSNNSPGGRFLGSLTAQSATPSPQCSCGYKKRNRIVGGEETSPNEYPMMAGIIYVQQRIIACGGVIINTRYIMTAAHCVVNREINDLAVIVGEHDVTTGNDSPATQGFRVLSYIVHQQYNPSSLDYDIAIVTINGQITYSEYVGPVCLPFKFGSTDFAGSNVTVLGWGTTSPGGPTSDRLRKVTLQVITRSQCQRQVSTLTPRQMCTYTPGKDACQFDSGGPVLYRDPSTGLEFSAGIVSFGRFCASTEPGVNTLVTSVLNWIVTNAPANYCRK